MCITDVYSRLGRCLRTDSDGCENPFKVGMRIVLEVRDVAFPPSSKAKSSKDFVFSFNS